MAETFVAERSSKSVPKIDIYAVASEGIFLCRKGHWQTGLEHLAWVAEQPQADELENAGLVYSYLGYGLAQTRARHVEALELCKKSVTLQHWEPDNFYNLARVYGMRGHVTEAYQAIHEGLRLDSSHAGLRRLNKQLDRREPPVLQSVPRSSTINAFLGRLRHRSREPLESLNDDIEAELPDRVHQVKSWDYSGALHRVLFGIERLWIVAARRLRSL